MLLRQLGVVDNSGGGEISSDRSFTLAATALSNRGGRVISGDSLTLRIAQALDNSLKAFFPQAEGWMSLHSSSTTIAASLLARAIHASG